MTVPEQAQNSPVQMPAAAERALRRATGHTLTSFAYLRKALRDHVECERGDCSLADIQTALPSLVARVRMELPIGPADAGQDNLSDHLIEWTDAFFRTPRNRG